MIKKLLVTSLLVLALTFALPTGNKAEAAYNPEHDIYLEFNLPFDIPFLTEELALKMFNIQEALHKYLRENHDIDIEYSYIWIVINGKVVLAIDPPLVVINEGF